MNGLLQIYNDKRPLKCEVGLKMFRTNGILNTQKLTSAYNCIFHEKVFCEKVFFTLLMSITDETNAGDMCSLSFISMDHFARRLKTHMGELPYQCSTYQQILH